MTLTLCSHAYSVACLGVSESDWETLGTEALNSLDLEVAKKSYMRIKNMPWLYLLDSMEVCLESPFSVFRGTVISSFLPFVGVSRLVCC